MNVLNIRHIHIHDIPDTAFIDWMGDVHIVDAHVPDGLLLTNTETGEHSSRLFLEFAFVLNYDVPEVDPPEMDMWDW